MFSATNKSNMPNTIIIGAMRSATTWVYNYLKSRGIYVCLLESKRLFFSTKDTPKALTGMPPTSNTAVMADTQKLSRWHLVIFTATRRQRESLTLWEG